jgi:serine/threonine protein phosphatase PrpC
MANRAVCEAALRFAGGDLEGRVPMGTTAVVAVSRGNQITLSWLGDSRAYLVGSYGAALLTADQNQAGERLRMWLEDAELGWAPTGFALVGYVGHFNEWTRPEPIPCRTVSFKLLPGERIVICSDGITDYIGDTHPTVSQTIGVHARYGTCDDACRRLVELGNRGGGGDNLTVAIAEILGV